MLTEVGLGDFLSDFYLLYFSKDVDDIGGSWLYPWRPYILREPQLVPGYNLWPWQLATEGVLLLSVFWWWLSSRSWLTEGQRFVVIATLAAPVAIAAGGVFVLLQSR